MEDDVHALIDLCVDAASGGFLAPFCAPDLVCDFRLPRVRSIKACGHTFDLAPLGVGWVLWRETTDLPEEGDDQLGIPALC